MSTENLNNNTTSQAIDPQRENEILSFVESMNESTPTPAKVRRQHKWLAVLQRRFRRRTLTLFATSAATILLAVAMVVVLLGGKDTTPNNTSTQNPEETVETETPKITLLDKTVKTDSADITQLQQIDVTNADDTYTILRDDKTNSYYIKDYQDIDLADTMVTTLRSYTETIAAAQKVSDVADLSAYGLDKPQVTASISYADGTSARLLLGNQTPSTSGFYGRLEGDDNVYIFDANTAALFRFQASAFVNTTLITAPTVKSNDKYGAALLKEISFTGSAFPTPLVMRRSNHNDSEDLAYFSYIITAPYLRCTTDKASAALAAFTSLTADQALFLHPTEEQKKKLGFDDPLMKITATMAVETEETTASDSDDEVKIKNYYNIVNYNLIIGSTDQNGNYITMLEGVDAIFLVSKASYEFVLGRTYENTVNTYLFFKHISSLERISVEFNGEKHDFHLTHYPDEEHADDQLVITKDGKVYSTEEFRELYELIMALERHDIPDEEPTGDASLILSLYETGGNLYLSAEYYDTSASLCTVKTSQGEILSTLWSDVSFFIKQVENYLNGKNVLIRN